MNSTHKVSSRVTIVRWLSILLGIALISIAFNPNRVAYAVSITVTTTADGIDAAGSCAAVTLASLPGPDGQTSLREAVCAANTNAGADIITFSVNGTFALTGAANDDNGGSGDLDIKQSLVVQGNGTSNTIIDGSGTERIFDVFPSAASTFDLSNLTMQNGDTRTTSFKEGGAMYLHNNVTSSLTNCAITNNFSGANGAIENRGTLTIEGSLISNNQTLPASGSVVGGGIHNAGTLTINNTTISNNSVRGEGGGIATTTGVGVIVTINNSTISGNTASVTGGGLGNGGGMSTTGNQGTINLTNSTISGNRADNNGGGIYFVTPAGGTGNATLNNVTITNNTADNDNNGTGAGGGFAQNTAAITLRNTIVAGNFNSLPSVRDDISGAVVAASSYNLIGDGTGSSGLTNGVNNNQVGSGGSPINAELGTLANNGGSTATHALLTGSPAINTANNATCAVTDQRGVTRPSGGICDIGAYELSDTTPPDTTITSTPTNPSNSNSATFSFSGSDTGGSGLAGFQCRIDGGSFSACTSPMSYSGLSNGSHTFQVRAIDGAGNSDPTPASYTWGIDTTPPTVTIDQAAGQADPTSTSPINFTVIFNEAVTGFDDSDLSFTGSTVGGTLSAVVSGGPTNYNVAVSGMTTSGTVIATVPANSAIDAAGNANTASTSTDNTVTFDTTPPTVTIDQAAGQADPTSTSPINFTVIFNEAVTGFDDSDLSFTGSTVGGTLSAVVSGGPTNYNVAVSGMTTSGTVIATVPANSAIDAAGNANTASTSTDNTVTFDTTSPTVTIDQAAGQADPTSTSPINFTVIFNEAVTGFTGSDLSFTASTTGGTLSAVVSGGPTNYNVAVSGMTTSGTVIATVPANSAIDATGNANTASTSTDNTVTFDTTSPTVTIDQAAGQADPTSTSPINFTVIFNEAVTGFTGSDLSFTASTTGGTLSAVVTGGPTNYNVAVSGMTTSGTVIATVPANSAVDAAGNNNTASTSTDNTVTFDATPPTVTINQAAGQADPTSTSPINFTVIFNEAVTGFTGSDLSFTGSTVGGTLSAVVSGGPTNYNVAVSGMTASGTVIATVPANSAIDATGNANTASTSTDNTVTFDTTSPTVTIDQAAGQADPTSTSPINFTVVFNEAVTGFTGSDLSFTSSTTGGTLSAVVSGGPTNYNVAVSGMTTSGAVIATVPANSAIDAAGNANTASTSTDNTVTFDTTPPTVTIDQAAGQADPTSTSPINFTVVFNEAVTGFDDSDLSFTGSTVGGTLSAVVTGGPTNYNVAVSGMTTSGAVIATVPANSAIDGTGNANTASTSTDNTVTFDTTSPTVTIDQAAGQADPTSTSPINFTVIFNEAVTGFTGSDLSFTASTTGGTLSAVVSGGPTNYNVAVSGMTTSGAVIVTVPANSAIDGTGNANTASTSTDNTVTFDTTPPTVTIDQAAGQADPTSTSPINFTVIFNEAVTGFDDSDLSFTGSTTGGTLSAVVTGGPTNYNVAVSGMTTSGTVIATVPANSAIDAAGNANTASTSTDNAVTFDTTSPTVTIDQAAGQADPTSTSPINFTVIFNEAVTGFDDSDLSFTGSTVGGTLSAVVSGGPTNYNVAVSGMTTSGTVIATVPANSAIDATGNANTASTSTDNTVTFDTTSPTVTIDQAAGQADPTSTSPINFTVVFNEAVTGFTGSDLSFTGSTVGGTLSAVVSGGPTNYNVAVSGMTTSGTVIATVPANSAIDGTGNANTASTSTDNTVTFNQNVADATIMLSSDSNGSVPGLSYRDEDIIAYDPGTGLWSLVFDGSDVGLGNADIDGFAFLPNGQLLLSVEQDFTLSGFGAVDDADILRFMPGSYGPTTAGSYVIYFDGSDVGLNSSDEDVDAIDFDAAGNLLISVNGAFSAENVKGNDEDLFVLTDFTSGADTTGTWGFYFDGSDVSLTSSGEDIFGLWADHANSKLYLATTDSFSVPGASGDEEDIFVCQYTSLGNNTACIFSLFWHGEDFGFDDAAIDGLSIGALPTVVSAAESSGGFAVDDTVEFEGDDVNEPNPLDGEEIEDEEALINQLFLPLVQQ